MAPQSVLREQAILRAHRILLRAGLTLVTAFGWIFIFQFALEYSGSISDAFYVALLVYGLSQVTLLVMTPMSAAHLRHGVKRAMMFGALFAALAYAVLGATLAGFFSSPLSWGVVLFAILLGGYRALYWIPYRLQAVGRPKAPHMLFELLLAILPMFAGVTLASEYLSPLRLLFGAAALMCISILPLMFLRDIGEPFRWGYFETFGRLFDKRYRFLSLHATLSGVESTALFLVWPLAVFLIVGGSYFMFGSVLTASLLILLAVRSIYPSIFKNKYLQSSALLSIVFSISGWVLRLAAGNPFMIVFADSYSYVSSRTNTPEVAAGEHASDAGAYIDEYTALQEVGMAFGRIVMCALVALIIHSAPLSVALALSLILAGCAAGAATAISHRIKIEAY